MNENTPIRKLPVLYGTVYDARTKLSGDEREEIKRSTLSLRVLAKQFGVSKSTISRVRSGRKQGNYNGKTKSNNDAVQKTRQKKRDLQRVLSPETITEVISP